MVAILSLRQREQIAAAPTSAPVSVPSPGGGWNTRDSFDAMDPLDAVVLDNWFPDAGGGINVRNGFTPFLDDLGTTPVETLAEFNSGVTPAPTVKRFVAACGGNVYEISSATAVLLKAGMTNARFQTVGFLGHLFLVNGGDAMQDYDGATMVDAGFTGVDTSTLIGIWQHQQRIFAWQANSTGFWYALLNSINGVMAFYDLGAFCPRGGSLIAMTTISYDGGNGVLNYAVFIMSSGDAMVFEGNDPALAANWKMVGAYRLSPPVSPRAVCNYGGDSFLTTFDDHVSFNAMFSALRDGKMPPRSKVSRAVQLAVQADQSAFGWQALFYPRGRALIFNIPNPDGSFDQHVCNTGIPEQPWCRYVGMNASCFGLFNDRLYFGGAAGVVYLADSGSLDDGAPVNAVGQQAWNKLKSPQRKRLAAVRPIMQSVGGIAYNFEVGFDYRDLDIPIPAVTPGTGSPWNTSPWDTSPWSSGSIIDPRWRIGGGSGTAVGWGVAIAATQPVAWLRTDLRLERGNAL